MPDREAFVAAIAANPADDLPRLVFADWLDEHGDPERAEFIRTQIRWHHASADEREQLDARAGELFREHWPRWFGPFVMALQPQTDLHTWTAEFSTNGGMILPFNPQRFQALREMPAVTYLFVRRGFVAETLVAVERWGQPASLADALRLEPVDTLACSGGLPSARWVGFTDPSLRHVSSLTLVQQWTWGLSAPESTALLEDPYLAGVRSFALRSVNDTFQPAPLPKPWLERFVRSSLAYRLTGLSLSHLGPDGVAPLCRPGRLHLERLQLGGELNADGVRRIGGSELGESVQELKLNEARLEDSAAAALARDDWRKLTRLAVRKNQLTTAVLPALAAAEFTPRLKALDLSGNPLFDGTDFRGLERLADALDPDRLQCLDLIGTGLSVVPDFLVERFGDRVVV